MQTSLMLLYVYILQDIINDVEGAQNVGMRGILVKTGIYIS